MMSLVEGGVGDVAMLWPAARALADGVMLGLLVALGALGLALIVATTRLVNFAHAALVAAGGYVAFFLNTRALGLHIVAIAVAVLLDSVLGFVYFFLVPGGALRPFEHTPSRPRCT